MLTLSSAIKILGLDTGDCVKLNGEILTVGHLINTYDLKMVEIVKIEPWISISDGAFEGYKLTAKFHRRG